MNQPSSAARRRSEDRWAVAAYPLLAVASHVISHVSYYGVPLWAGLRPLAVALLVTLAIQLALAALTGRQRGSFIAAIVATFVVGAIFSTLALLAIAAGRTLLRLRRRAGAPSWPSITRGLNVLAVALLLVTLVTAWSTETFSLARSGSTRGVANGGSPNIYMLMLDGYPRSDTVAGWGFDNSGFEEELESLGFDVSRRSHSNYTKTWLSLASMMDMRVITADSFDGQLPGEAVQHRWLSTIFNEAATWDELRQRGYEIVATETAFADLALYTADRTVGAWPVNAFETDLLRLSPISRLGFVQDRVVDAHRARVEGQFRETAAVAGDGPRLVWSHILSPHAPAVFDPAGGFIGHPCWPGCQFFLPQAEGMGLSENELGRRLGGQVEYVNGLALESVRTIEERDPEAVIVILSDHGSRLGNAGDEYFHNFFAARTPGHPHLFPDDVGMITTMAVLLNAYFDAQVDVPDGDREFLSAATLLELVEWPLPGD
jgi:hypothetical protein